MTAINFTHLLSDALATEWMMTRDACVALKRIYLDALGVKSQVGHLTAADIEHLWAEHERDGLGETMHMLREEESSMAAQTEPMKGTNYTSIYKGVAIIDLIGPIVPRVRGMSSGSIGAQQVRNDFITAFESENVKAKPIHSYAAGWMASAAYFISAASHRIVTNDWGSLGSIGVVIAVPPKMEGDDIEFVNTESPYKRPDATSDEGKGVYQQKADYMGGLFIDAVAELRGVARDKVISDFGKGGTLIGKQAVKAGLADALGTFDGALHALITSKPLGGAPASASGNGETSMSEKKWYQKLFAGLSGDERKEALEALKEGEGGAASPGGGSQSSSSEASVDAATREKAAAYDKMVGAQRVATAEAFAKETIEAKKALPFGFESLKAQYLAAAEDDARSPLASGSRVENLKAMFTALPAHNLTKEQAAAELPPNAKTLAGDPDPVQKMAEEARTGAREWAQSQLPASATK
jgi:ClpP class serine protease